MIRILFQGDSITDGNRLKPVESRWDLNHQIGHSYVYPIAGKLGYLYPGKYTVINRGVSGDTVERIAARWETDTLAEHPDILSILLGINGNGKFDGTYPEGTEEHLRAFDEQYRALLGSARKQNPDLKLILIEPFTLPCGHPEPYYDRFYPVFRRKQDIIRRIAEDFDGIFVPIQNDLEDLVRKTAPVLAERGCGTDPNAYWLWDGVHPTEPLHWFIAEKWLAAAAGIL